jgi:hypothetical protein
MRFEILGEISGIETFATASGIREIVKGLWARSLAQTQGDRSRSVGG